MQVIRYDNVDDFLVRTQSFLEQDEPANSIVLGNCLRMKQFPQRVETPPLFATVEEDNHVVLAVMMTPPFRLSLASNSSAPQAAIDALCDALLPEQESIPGVFANEDLAAAFAAAWLTRTGQTSRERLAMLFYVLTAVKSVNDVPGKLRVATAADAGLLTGWFQGFSKDVFEENVEIDEARKRATTRINDGDLYVWEDGRVVSMAAKARPTTHGITVNHVYTPPECRRHGYGTACVAALSQSLLDAGWRFCCLYADVANPTSNGIYQRIGYEPVCRSVEHIFETRAVG